jgi:hypothetical protein
LCSAFQTLPVHKDAAHLCCSHHKKEKVDRCEGNILRLDDEAPAGPEGTSRHKSEILGEGEGFRGAREIGDTGEDDAPFQNGGPEQNKMSVELFQFQLENQSQHRPLTARLCSFKRTPLGARDTWRYCYVPEMHSFGPNWAIPEPGELAPSRIGRRSMDLPTKEQWLAKERVAGEVGEETSRRSEGHGGAVEREPEDAEEGEGHCSRSTPTEGVLMIEW